MLGVDTDASLLGVLEHAAASGRQPDIVLATGDIAQQARESTYKRFVDYVGHYFPGVPLRWLAGNHDAIMPMTRIGRRRGPSLSAHCGAWHFALLDSHLEGHVPGRFSDAELAALDAELASAPGRFSLIGFHHHPLPVGSQWIDTQLIDNADALFAIVDAHPRVRGLIFGHVHQQVDGLWRSAAGIDVRVLGTPSTCFQFLPNSDDYALDEDAAPGYRWLELRADGHIGTHVARVAHLRVELDLAAGGY